MFYVSLCISVTCLFLRLWIVRRLVNFPVRQYVTEVIGRCILICILSLIVPLAVHLLLPQSFLNTAIVCCLSIVASLVTIYSVGINSHERDLITKFVKKTILHIN